MVTFSILLTQIAEEENMNMREMLKFLQDKGVDVSYTSLTSYRSFRSIPSYDVSKAILEAFGYETDNLPDILENSRKELKNYKEDVSNKLVRTIRVSPDDLGLETSEDINIILSQRASTLNKNVNEYIIDLIKNDLAKSGYIGG